MTLSPTSLPPERLGTLLRNARRHAQLSRRRAANLAGVSAAHLIALERGWETVTEPMLATLLDAYGTTVDQLVPVRAPLSVIDTVLHTGDHVRVAATTHRDDVLRAYLDMMGDARTNGTIDQFTLRAHDLSTLASVLDTDEDILTNRVAAILDCDTTEARSLARLLLTRVAGPALGLALGAAALAGSTGNNTVAERATIPYSKPIMVVAAQPVTTAAPTTVAPFEQLAVAVAAPPVVEPSTSTTAAALTAPTGESASASLSTLAAKSPMTGSEQHDPGSATGQPQQPEPPAPDTGVLPGETPTQIFFGG